MKAHRNTISVLITIIVVAAFGVSATISVGSGVVAAQSAQSETDEYAVSQGNQCWPIEPIGDGDQTVDEFYDYRHPDTDPSSYSYSSHGTTHLQEDDTSRLVLYEGSDGLSLVVIHDEYDGNSPGGAATMGFTGLPEAGEWVVEDDNYEGDDDAFDHQGPSSFEQGTSSFITWVWTDNRSDGAAFNGGLGDEFAITIDPGFNDDANVRLYDGQITDWQAISGTDDGYERVSLDMDEPVVIQTGSCTSYTVTELNTEEPLVAGESTTIEATVQNDGVLAETFTVPVTVDGEPVDEQEVTLEPGETTTLSTAVTIDEAGTYTVGVANATEDVTVEERDDTERDDEIPGFGIITATLAAMLVALIVRYRR